MSGSTTDTTVGGRLGSRTVTVPFSWFDSAFYVAYGNTIPQILNRLHADIAAVQSQFEEDSDLGLKALISFRERLGVAADWAERLEKAKQIEVDL